MNIDCNLKWSLGRVVGMSVLNKYEDITISNLVVNPENPRMMEELSNEAEAINFLLEDIPLRMKTLAQDIASKGYVYDPPLIRKEQNGSWKVYDGNRRVSCVKLLNDPSILNNKDHRDYFTRLVETYKANIPSKINCRIEDDQKVIDDILERRHAGGDTGIGQMPWKPDEKDRFFERASISHKPRFGTELSKLLREKGILGKTERIKVSIFDRLLSSEDYRNKVGVTFKGNTINFVGDEKRSLKALQHIIHDAASGKVNLNKAWSNSEKDKYFVYLTEQGLLPINENDNNRSNQGALDKESKKDADSENNKIQSDDKKLKKTRKTKPYTRSNLIPSDTQFEFDTHEKTARIRNVIIELQEDLYFFKHLNSIAVMFRVLIEMCVDHYIETQKVALLQGKSGRLLEGLSDKYKACLTHMAANGKITKKDSNVLVRYAYDGQFLSIDTFHSYVHHRLAHPVQSDLIAMWDQIQPFIQQTLIVKDKDQKEAA